VIKQQSYRRDVYISEVARESHALLPMCTIFETRSLIRSVLINSCGWSNLKSSTHCAGQSLPRLLQEDEEELDDDRRNITGTNHLAKRPFVVLVSATANLSLRFWETWKVTNADHISRVKKIATIALKPSIVHSVR
jgi:hypothetical protein